MLRAVVTLEDSTQDGGCRASSSVTLSTMHYDFLVRHLTRSVKLYNLAHEEFESFSRGTTLGNFEIWPAAEMEMGHLSLPFDDSILGLFNMQLAHFEFFVDFLGLEERHRDRVTEVKDRFLHGRPVLARLGAIPAAIVLTYFSDIRAETDDHFGPVPQHELFPEFGNIWVILGTCSRD